MPQLSTYHASILRHIAGNHEYRPGPDDVIACNDLYDRGLVGRIESDHGLFCYYPTMAGLKVIEKRTLEFVRKAADMWSVIKHLSNTIIPVVKTRCKVTAFDIYDKEARTLMKSESLEVWNNGKLVSRCQYEECKHENG